MISTIRQNPALVGSLCALAAVFCFSINDVSIKFLSGGYALHQVVLIRATIGTALLLGLVLPFMGGLSVLRTQRLGMHLLRGLCVVVANMTFFLGLAALPLAVGVAIFFISPVVITVFSVIFLKETVGPRRWAAVVMGFIGVLVVLRPGTEAFQPAAILPLIAAFGYATLHMLTRHIGKTESAQALTFYIQITFILVSGTMGLAFGQGQFAEQSDLSLAFMFRAWVWPAPQDYWIFLLIGAASTAGGFFISQAYRVAEAAVVAPVEYVAMPIAVISGLLVFGEWPDPIAWAGIALILGSGLYMVWRDSQSRNTPQVETPRYRR